MAHLGEIISLAVAVSWTATALFADEASHRLGSLPVNVIRLVLGSVFLGLILWFTIGAPYPRFADGPTWFWLALSALVGYLFGDFCLFNSYLIIGARFGQLFMTLAPPMAAIAGWAMLGETLSWRSILAMLVTISGIAISILAKGNDKKMHFTLPFKGILLGLGAGAGQGIGLVLSKVGMQHYEAALPVDVPAAMGTMMPFAATQIRALVGGLGFVIMLLLQRQGKHFLEVTRQDHKGVRAAVLTTIFGPVVGVSLSLMAVQYARAGIASTLMALTPVLIILPYAIIHKQKVKPKEILGVTLSMIGVAMFFLL